MSTARLFFNKGVLVLRGSRLTIVVLVALWLSPVEAQLERPAQPPTPDAIAQSSKAAFLRLIDRPRVPLAPEETPPLKVDRFVVQRFTFASEANERVPGITVALERPFPARRPVVIVLHGTGDSKEAMSPLLEHLADRGFIAVAIDGRHHGERARQAESYVLAIINAFRTHDGFPFLYDTVWDASRLVDYLQTRVDIDRTRIGMLGISKGGMETYLTAAVDPRVAVAVPVIAAQSFRWGLENNAWQGRVDTFQAAMDAAARDLGLGRPDAAMARAFYDRVAPGIYGQFDGPAMLPLIAPRPLLLINGDSDERTPLPGVQECATAAESAYQQQRVSDRFRLFLQLDTGHFFTPEAQVTALAWLTKWLNP